ncbi:hypothetical protein [Microbacterium sp. USTB-Y]|uniref:hypothetical protein n=1 Tax=Microbacterium sp. USTB-Y TaxID=2823692 RepID=UPI00204175E6|nr:hypothetical protein [Microbacterium sp. USTB-Y]
MATLTDIDSLSEAATTAASASEIPPLDWAGEQLPEAVRDHPLLDAAAWDEKRDEGRRPLDESALVGNFQARAEFLVGAWIINEIVPSRIVAGGLLANLQPQMLRTVDVIGVGAIVEDGPDDQDGAGSFLNAVLEPRRSAKTTTLWCILLGRCWMRAVYMAGYTMLTTAKKAGERFKLDVRDPITRKWRDKPHREKVIGIKLMESNGSLGVEFANGSKLAILSPNGDDVRSGAYDTLVLDEGGEAEPEMWDDIVGAVVPSFDTRPGAQLIYAGTGGKYRDGSHFWATLHDPTAGRIRFGVPDDIEDADIQTWDQARAIIEALHPGLDGLTNMAKIAKNFPILGPQRFGMEYLGHFGRAAGNDVVLGPEWAATLQPGAVPEGVTPLALAFAVHPSGLWTSVAIAWYMADEGGDLARTAWVMDGDTEAAPPRVAFKLVHHQEGNAGMPGVLWRLWKQTRLPIIHDDSPQEKEIIQQLNRQARPRPQVTMLRFAEKKVGTTKLINGLKHGTTLHWAQEPLDTAAAGAVRRLSAGAVLFGAPATNPEFDVTPLEAAAAAIYKLPDPGVGESFAPIVVS